MTTSPPAVRTSRLGRWLLDGQTPEPRGFYEPDTEATHHETKPWWRVMCLTGVDYFSTLGYQPGIAALAAGALAPIATLVLVLVTLFGALPMYRRVAEESPHGDGSLSMLERLLSYWPSKALVLSLLGFVATGFIITITLSAADASAHLIENPFLHDALEGRAVIVTIALISALAVVFLRGFSEAIGVAVVLVACYIGLSLVVVLVGFQRVLRDTSVVGSWTDALSMEHATVLGMIGAALLVFPALALGLSGFETGVVVMPLVEGDETDTPQAPVGRIRNAKRLLTTAALLMSVMLVGSSLVTTWLIPPAAFEAGGDANGRALAYLAHNMLGDGFGTLYDAATIGILWFAGASAMAGLLNIVPRYLPRYGMAPAWAKATRPLVLVFGAVALLVTVLFDADVEAQAGAYATGVLALMTSAAVAVTLSCRRRGETGRAVFFGLVTAVFVYTSAVTVVDHPGGLVVAGLFIAATVAISLVSRAARSTELRIQRVVFDEAATMMLGEVLVVDAPVRLIANKKQAGDDAEYDAKSLDVRMDNHLDAAEAALFVEVDVDDASDFNARILVTARRIGPHRVLRASGPSTANVLAAILLAVRDIDDMPPHIYFEWSERGPLENALRFLFLGEGDVPAVTREILRRAEPEESLRPQCHVGG
ncbi:amino acid transporter [Nocardioides sp.]|uniref:amino acid transporter n=1 Tax=Nocardioides sp. TaxID=35761 RepID=UPI003515F110